MAVSFVSSVSWPVNELLLPAEYFDVSVPSGLGGANVRYPKFVGVAEMMRLSPNTPGSSKGQLSMVDGLVVAVPKIRFADAKAQWRRSSLSGSGHGPWKFEFQGGEVRLDVELALYLAQSVDWKVDDDLSVKIFARIYEHELLHVLDELDIARSWLPPHLLGEPYVDKYLAQGDPYIYGVAASGDPDGDFEEFISKIFVANIYNFWVTEKNRRARLRDAPAQYKIVQDKVDALRAAQINRH